MHRESVRGREKRKRDRERDAHTEGAIEKERKRKRERERDGCAMNEMSVYIFCLSRYCFRMIQHGQFQTKIRIQNGSY